jgi:F420 biosynthesis protein FbiB-like protein
VLTRIIETATYAPSAHNRQPWRFAVIRQADSKTRLSEFLGNDFRKDLLMDGLPESEILAQLDRSKNRINESPVIIILCMDVSEMDVYMDGKRSWAEQTMAIQSVAAAGLQLQLAAHAEGLASVWTCAPLFSPHAVKLALDMPEHWDPQAMFFIGYSAGLPKEKKMKSLHEVVKYY